MKKNLIFLTLLISVLMVSVVSAGITGYLVRGSGIADAGYTATLQKVEGTTAIVSVRTPTGDTELVRVAEGETAKVGAVEVKASDLRAGSFFRRAGAKVELQTVTDDVVVGPNPIGSGTATGHTHLSDYEFVSKSLDQTHITPTQIAFRNKIGCTEEFGSDYVVLGGGFDLFSEESTKNVKVFANHPDDGGTSYNVYVIADEPTLSGNPMMYATCARVEPTLHQFSLDY